MPEIAETHMHASEHPLLAFLEERFDALRQHHAETHNSHRDIVMTLAEKFSSVVDKLISRLDGHDALLDAAKKAEAAAEAERDKIKSDFAEAQAAAKADADAMAAKVADLEAKLAAELDPAPFQAVIDKIEAITGTADAPAAPAPSDAPAAEAPASEPVAAPTATVNDIVAADVPEADASHIAAAVAAHDDAVAAGSTPGVAHADAVSAAAAAGAEPEVAVKIADSVATNPPTDGTASA